jgi:hypothetical protein
VYLAVAALVIAGLVGYVGYGESLVLRHRRDCEATLSALIGQRVLLVVGGRMYWTVNGVVEDVTSRAVRLRPDDGRTGEIPFTLVRHIQRVSHRRDSLHGPAPSLRQMPWWRSVRKQESPDGRKSR